MNPDPWFPTGLREPVQTVNPARLRRGSKRTATTGEYPLIRHCRTILNGAQLVPMQTPAAGLCSVSSGLGVALSAPFKVYDVLDDGVVRETLETVVALQAAVDQSEDVLDIGAFSPVRIQRRL